MPAHRIKLPSWLGCVMRSVGILLVVASSAIAQDHFEFTDSSGNTFILPPASKFPKGLAPTFLRKTLHAHHFDLPDSLGPWKVTISDVFADRKPHQYRLRLTCSPQNAKTIQEILAHQGWSHHILKLGRLQGRRVILESDYAYGEI